MKKPNYQPEISLSIVIPVYNEEKVLLLLFDQLQKLLNKLTKHSIITELVFVNDGSTDNSAQIIDKWAKKQKFPVTLVNLSRNFGHQAALTAGYTYASGKYLVTIDADLQDPPELILKMYKKAVREKADIVLAQRSARNEAAVKKLTAAFYYKLINLFSNDLVIPEVADFRLISARVRDIIIEIKETPRFYRGLVNWVGFKRAIIRYKRSPRAAGKTKYSIRKMFNLALTGLINYGTRFIYYWTIYTIFIGLITLLLPPKILVTSFIILWGLPTLGILLIYSQNLLYLLQNKPEFIIAEIKQNSYYGKINSKRPRKTKKGTPTPRG